MCCSKINNTLDKRLNSPFFHKPVFRGQLRKTSELPSLSNICKYVNVGAL